MIKLFGKENIKNEIIDILDLARNKFPDLRERTL